MKKLLLGFLVLLLGITTTACERRDPNQGRVVPKGTQIEFQIWTAQEPDFVEAMVREFISSTRETGLVAKVVPFANDTELQNFLLEKMAEGSGPDVILTEGNWIAKNSKKIIPLEGDETFTVPAFENTFMKAASEVLHDGQKIYGVPVAVDTLAIIYNEEHLVDRLDNRNTPAKTWDEFRQDVDKLSQEDNSFERFKSSGAAIGRLDNLTHGFDLLTNIMVQMGTEFFSPDKMSATFATKKSLSPKGERVKSGTEAVKFFTSFADQRYKNYSWNEQLVKKDDENLDFDAFVRGKTSMVFGYARDLERIEDLAAQSLTGISTDSIGTELLPQFSDSGNKEALAKVYAFAVPRTTENSQVAWKFLKYTSGKEIQSSFFGNTGLPSARLDLVSEQSQTPNLGTFVRQAKFAKNQVWPLNEADLKREFEVLIDNLNSGRFSADSTMEALEKKVTEDLKAYWQREKTVENTIKKQQEAAQARNEKK